jgi:tRNA pseudouridine32 synthase/23S rRNA pseudouridine746 synthase
MLGKPPSATPDMRDDADPPRPAGDGWAALPGGPPPPLIYAPPVEPWLAILHEDDDLVALDKPSGLLSVPGKPAALADSAQSRAEARWPGARPVHRLDLGASGVLLLAKTPRALRILSGQFAKRLTGKRYVARLAGRLAANEGRIDQPLRADWPNRPRQMAAEDGKPALTEWRVLLRGDDQTLVALTPHTGRSHQLRVHMALLGHPILGDPLYGDAASAERLMLHAERLTVRHPADGRTIAFAAPVPF